MIPFSIFLSTKFRLTRRRRRRRRSKILSMVVVSVPVSTRIRSAYALTKAGFVDGRADILKGILDGSIPPKLGYRAVSRIESSLTKKGLYKPPLREKGMNRLDIELKTSLDLIGVPGHSSERK